MSEAKPADRSPSSSTNQFRLTRATVVALITIFVFALGLRIWAAVLLPAPLAADSADYHRLAVGLVSGQGYIDELGRPTAWRPPGYPFFVAAIYSILGSSPSKVYVVQAILGSLTVIMLMSFAFLIAGPREALVTGIIATIYPSFFWLSRVLLSESLSIFLVTGALLLSIPTIRGGRWIWGGRPIAALALGIALGAAILVRGANLFLAALFCCGIAVSLWRSGISLVRTSLVCSSIVFGIALVLAPWSVRNYLVFHRSVPVATQDGMALYSSYWPPSDGKKLIWGNLPGVEDPVVRAATQTGDEVAVSDYLRKATWSRLRANPGRFFELLPAKLIALVVPFDWETFPHQAGKVRSINFGYVLVLLPALAGALVLRRRRTPEQWLLWVIPISVFAQALVFYGSPRFRLSAEISAVVMAAVGICWLLNIITSKSRVRRDREESAIGASRSELGNPSR